MPWESRRPHSQNQSSPSLHLLLGPLSAAWQLICRVQKQTFGPSGPRPAPPLLIGSFISRVSAAQGLPTALSQPQSWRRRQSDPVATQPRVRPRPSAAKLGAEGAGTPSLWFPKDSESGGVCRIEKEDPKVGPDTALSPEKGKTAQH